MCGRKRSGFTLIELLVVISIVVLLMALLLPALSRARKQTRAVVCQARLRQWGIAFCAYVADNDGKMIDGVSQSWYVPLKAYCTDCNDMLRCPAVPPQALTNSIGTGTSTEWNVPWTAAYGDNASLAWKNYDNLSGRRRMPAVFDCLAWSVRVHHEDNPPEYEGDSLIQRSGRDHMKLVCTNRHSGGVNMLFLDWSVRKVGLKELWTLTWGDDFDTAGPWTKAGGVQPTDWPQWMRKFKDY